MANRKPTQWVRSGTVSPRIVDTGGCPLELMVAASNQYRKSCIKLGTGRYEGDVEQLRSSSKNGTRQGRWG